MKKISELGLELIELEGELLLVDEHSKGEYMFTQNLGGITREFKIIASTKPLKGLPLLVIEDEVKKLADIYGDRLTDNPVEVEDAFIAGYNKARQTYKFTELDLRFALDYGRSQGYEYASMETFQDSEDLKNLELEQKEDKEEFIQSLTKKELWIEVDGCSDCHLNDGYMSSPNCCREVQPKITENKIKAV